MLKSPCERNCPRRSATCHAECKKWAEYEAAKQAEYAKRDAERAGIYSTHDRMVANLNLKKKSKKGGAKSYC